MKKTSQRSLLFRHIGPFVREGAEVLRADGFRDGMETLLFRNPDGEIVLVCACSSGIGSVKKYPRPRLYVKYANEMAQLALPHGTWSVTTMVFSRRR